MKIKLAFFFLLNFFVLEAYAGVVTESWLRQAGISCGGGLSVELQGEIDAAVIRRLKIGSVEGEGSYQLTETETLLKQFQKEEKRRTYTDYLNCLLTLMNMASNTSQLPPREVVLKSSLAIASLETIKRGQRFVMAPGDTVAIKNHALIFTIDSMHDKRPRSFVYFTWSNSETGEGRSHNYVYQSNLIKFGKSCSIVPYKIDTKNNQVSLLSNC